jgi:hypothetical protein
MESGNKFLVSTAAQPSGKGTQRREPHIGSIDSYILAVFATAWAWHKRAVHAMSGPDFQPVVTRTDKNGITRQLPNPGLKFSTSKPD